METEIKIPQTLKEAIELFSDEEFSFNFLVNFRWPEGVKCPFCGSIARHAFIKTRKTWQCKECKKRFTIKVGSIMEDSPLPLSTWFAAMWLISNAKNGISSYEVARALGVTQKTGWFLLHRVRHIMQTGSVEKMSGPIEVDETFIGGLEKNKHTSKKQNAGRGGVGKQIVMGILERGIEKGESKVRTKVVSDTGKDTLQSEIKAQVEPGAEVYTDAHKGYHGLDEDFKHAFVDHAIAYAEGRVHTNGIENFWSLFDRMLGGTYIHIDPRHLASYFDEESYRFNHQKTSDAGRFLTALMAITGKRLTWEELTERGLAHIAPKE